MAKKITGEIVIAIESEGENTNFFTKYDLTGIDPYVVLVTIDDVKKDYVSMVRSALKKDEGALKMFNDALECYEKEEKDSII